MTSSKNTKAKSTRVRDTLVMAAATTFAIVFAAIGGSSNREEVDESQPVISSGVSLGLSGSNPKVESAITIVDTSRQTTEQSIEVPPQYVVVPFPAARTRAS